MQQLIDNVYSQFKLAVSKARGIDSKEMDKIADGRIFTGEQAKNLKLIDELGTLSDAISLAGSLSGIKGEPNVSYYPKKKMNFLDFILSKFETEIISGLPLKGRFGLFYLVDM
jgi:protease-4